MRTFIGLELDRELKLKLKSIQKLLKTYSSKGSWVDVDNFHITLKFLGETNRNEITKIGEIIKKVSKKYPPINLSLDRFGYFNNKKGKIGVLWLGSSEEVKELIKLHNDIENELTKLNFPKEKRRFKPHITLGRRIVLNQPFNEIKAIIEEDLNYDLKLDTISLIKSEVIMNKRTYTTIKSNKFL